MAFAVSGGAGCFILFQYDDGTDRDPPQKWGKFKIQHLQHVSSARELLNFLFSEGSIDV
jgi:hypothetical protein